MITITSQAAILWPLALFFFGLCVGSYLNVVALRWFERQRKHKTNSLTSRSRCPHCHKTLAWYDLVPLLSFAVLRGQCRQCAKRISWRYPVVELCTGVLFVTMGYQFGITWLSVALLGVATVMLIIALVDLETQLIPDRLTIPTTAFVSLVLLVSQQPNLLGRPFIPGQIFSDHWLAGAVLAVIVLGGIVLLTAGKGMGIGDIKLGALMGATLGAPALLVALFAAFVGGAVVGVYLIVRGSASMKTAIPFGPFLVFGWFTALFCHASVISWYTGY